MKFTVKSLILTLALVFAGLSFSAPAWAEKASVYTARTNNLAVGGYDAVSYFSGTPVKGHADYHYSYNGAEWRFSSHANLDRFKADPSAFAPQYGGYCSWAVAQNKLAKGDPKYWNIVEGKLYLNYNSNIKRKWEKDIPDFIAKGDVNWLTILK